MDEKIDYELATEKQINWLRKHHYTDEEGLKIMSKKTASGLIEEMINNNGRARSLWDDYVD